MIGTDTIQFEDIARQRNEQSARAARTYTQRHAAVGPSARPVARERHWRIRWHHPAQPGIASS